MDVVNQNSGHEYRAYFFDEGDSPTIPGTVHWRLRNETTGAIDVEWTQVTPVPVVDESGLIEVYADIEVPGSANAVTSTEARELKTLLVVANKDQAGEYSQDPPHQYYVRRVKARL